MRKRKETVMGPDKWEDVIQKATKEVAKSMFSFKEGPKRKMLKVQYFKHPNIARYMYDRHLAPYGKLSWNDEVLVYFKQMFYIEFFWGMNPATMTFCWNFLVQGKVDYMTVRALSEMWSCVALSRHW